MDILKDLPSYDKNNFSKHSQGGIRSSAAKSYIRVRDGTTTSEDNKAQVIVMDTQSMLLRELEAEACRRKRINLKRSSNTSGQEATFNSRKVPKTEDDDDDNDFIPSSLET